MFDRVRHWMRVASVLPSKPYVDIYISASLAMICTCRNESDIGGPVRRGCAPPMSFMKCALCGLRRTFCLHHYLLVKVWGCMHVLWVNYTRETFIQMVNFSRGRPRALDGPPHAREFDKVVNFFFLLWSIYNQLFLPMELLTIPTEMSEKLVRSNFAGTN